MGTKRNPGEFDCYAKAEDDEPLFVLIARDADAPMMVKQWALFRQLQVNTGLQPESDRAQISEALRCATEMEIWHREHRARQQMTNLEFDHTGVPTTGQHAKKDRNSTSGALDK